MNIVYIALFLLFMFLLSDMISLRATDITFPDNKSLLLLDEQNENETLVLWGGTLIDGTDATPETDSVILINSSKIFAVTNQSVFRDYISLYDDHGSQINEGILLNLTGKYIMPGLFDMHAHIAGGTK